MKKRRRRKDEENKKNNEENKKNNEENMKPPMDRVQAHRKCKKEETFLCELMGLQQVMAELDQCLRNDQDLRNEIVPLDPDMVVCGYIFSKFTSTSRYRKKYVIANK